MLHDAQVEPQVELQHTPSTQFPVAHSQLLVQAVPCALSATHEVPLQYAEPLQVALQTGWVVHVVEQLPPLQV